VKRLASVSLRSKSRCFESANIKILSDAQKFAITFI